MLTELRPLPIPDNDSKQFWKGCRQEKFVIPKCKNCNQFIFFPRTMCPYCSSMDLEWLEIKGSGTIYSYTIVKRGPSPAFRNKVPYVLALIDLDEGPRMLSNVVNLEESKIKIGMRVRCIFEKLNDDISLPVFIGEL